MPGGLPGDGYRPAWWRQAGALLFWGSIQALPLLPRSREFARGYQPLLPPLVGLAFTLLLAAAFVWRFVLRRDAGTDYRRATFRLRPPPRAALRQLPLVAAPMLGLVIASLVVIPRFVPIPRQANNPLELYLKLPYAALTVLALVSVVAPLLEEFLFRGWVQRRLERRLSPGRAIAITATLFAAAHAEAFGFPIRLAFGLVAGSVAWSTRSIWPGVMLHALYNAALVLGGSATPDVDETTLERWAHTPAVFWPALGVFVLCAIALVFALRRVRLASSAESAAD